MSTLVGSGPGSVPTHVGPWRIEPDDSGAGLRRDPSTFLQLGSGLEDWSDIEVVPPPGLARRVVVVGESTARGWPIEDLLSPTAVLQRHLDAAGEFQCVDLAKIGANGEDLIGVAQSLPALAPSVVVSFAGNNWMLSPPADETGRMHPDAGTELPQNLADGLRTEGWAGMRSRFITAAMHAVHEYVALLADVRHRCGSAVVVVIPEYDLQGFAPPSDVEVPVLDPDATARWYGLYARARRALAAGEPQSVGDCARQMIALDAGCSPVPGWLAGQAAIAVGDGPGARVALEQSRDSVVGMLVRHTPRVTTVVREALLASAAEYGFQVVDMRRVLADAAIPELPDAKYFLDYCHLSDSGIETAVAAIADAVLDRRVGSASPGTGLTGPQRAFANARVAAHLAFQAQPDAAVIKRLSDAAAADPSTAELLRGVRDLLLAPSPAWIHPTTSLLAQIPPLRPFLPALVGPDAQWPELWSLLRCLDAVLGERQQSTAEPGDREIDVLALQAPHGHVQATWTPAHAHLVAGSSVSSLHLGTRSGGRPAQLRLEYRTPVAAHNGVAELMWETELLATLPASASWIRHEVVLPARVLEHRNPVVQLHWPIPRPDVAHAVGNDVAAMGRGDFPTVFPVHGEIYAATLVSLPCEPRLD